MEDGQDGVAGGDEGWVAWEVVTRIRKSAGLGYPVLMPPSSQIEATAPEGESATVPPSERVSMVTSLQAPVPLLPCTA